MSLAAVYINPIERPGTPAARCFTFDGLKVFRFTFASTGAPSIGNALPFAEQVRRALIRNRINASHSEAITGKREDGTPLDGHSHAHYLPTDEDHDGFIDQITIYAPRGFDNADMEALRSLKTIFRSGSRSDVHLRLIESAYIGALDGIGRGNDPSVDGHAGSVRSQELPSATSASIFQESRQWRSVTPFSLPRFPNRGGGKPPRPRDLPEGQLRREMSLRGLPEPVSVRPLTGYAVPGKPLIPWMAFHTIRHNGARGNGLAGFEIEFAEPVRGPISLGFACHFGLGLFLPVGP